MQLGEKIKFLRSRSKKTQDAIAQKAGISRQTLDAIENGREPNPGLETLEGIVKACNAKMGDLFVEKSPAAAALQKQIEIVAAEHADLHQQLSGILRASKRQETVLKTVLKAVHQEVSSRRG